MLDEFQRHDPHVEGVYPCRSDYYVQHRHR